MLTKPFIAAGAAAFGLFAASAAQAVTEASNIWVDFGDAAYADGFSDTSLPDKFNPGNAIDGDTATFFRMGLGSKALFDWGGRSIRDFTVIFETTYNCDPGDDPCPNYPEQVEVWAFGADIDIIADGSASTPNGPRPNFRFENKLDPSKDLLGGSSPGERLGLVNNGQAVIRPDGFELSLDPASGIDEIVYIMLVDRSPLLSPVSKDGFDIASVGATTVVPLPAGLPLLVAGVGMIAAGRRWLA